MNRCPISYEICEGEYSQKGLQLLGLKSLKDFPYGLSQQLELAIKFSDKLSFSGVQPKLNAKIDLNQGFEPVQSSGTFILKLPHASFEQLPQNEDLTMRLASLAGIEVPLHGMIYAMDRSLVYFVKRFDRCSSKKKIHTEDFGQLAGLPSQSKYDFSMEKVAQIIDQYCTFKAAEKMKLFRLTLFNFLIGNEDMHAKNFSVIREDEVTRLSPAYDLVNSTIVMNGREEIALPLAGKKSNLKRSDFLDYFAKERLQISEPLIQEILDKFHSVLEAWENLISVSFLSEAKKKGLSFSAKRTDQSLILEIAVFLEMLYGSL